MRAVPAVVLSLRLLWSCHAVPAVVVSCLARSCCRCCCCCAAAVLSCALRCGLASQVHIQSIYCVLYTSRRAFCSNCNAVLHGYAGWDPQPRFCTHHIQSGKCSFFVKTTAPSPICNAVLDGYAGWDPQARFKIRIVCARPYHALFMHNMLIRWLECIPT